MVVKGGRKGKSPLERLIQRRTLHVCTSKEGKVKLRWATGGYKLPGSLNRKK